MPPKLGNWSICRIHTSYPMTIRTRLPLRKVTGWWTLRISTGWLSGTRDSNILQNSFNMMLALRSHRPPCWPYPCAILLAFVCGGLFCIQQCSDWKGVIMFAHFRTHLSAHPEKFPPNRLKLTTLEVPWECQALLGAIVTLLDIVIGTQTSEIAVGYQCQAVRTPVGSH